jgi:hypothetical protein
MSVFAEKTLGFIYSKIWFNQPCGLAINCKDGRCRYTAARNCISPAGWQLEEMIVAPLQGNAELYLVRTCGPRFALQSLICPEISVPA